MYCVGKLSHFNNYVVQYFTMQHSATLPIIVKKISFKHHKGCLHPCNWFCGFEAIRAALLVRQGNASYTIYSDHSLGHRENWAIFSLPNFLDHGYGLIPRSGIYTCFYQNSKIVKHQNINDILRNDVLSSLYDKFAILHIL